jgi:hypothetical protein
MNLFLGCAWMSQRPAGALVRIWIAFPGQRFARPGLFSRGPSGTGDAEITVEFINAHPESAEVCRELGFKMLWKGLTGN